MKLNEALKYTDGHICKHPPTEVGVFYVESSEVRKIFRGNVHIKIDIAPDDPNNNAQQERLKCIRVELHDYSFVPRKINVQVKMCLLTYRVNCDSKSMQHWLFVGFRVSGFI